MLFIRFSLAAVLCCCCAGSALVDVQRITANVNETAILPCSIPLEHDIPTVEWSKDGLTPNITFLYRDGCEIFAEKNPDFHHRTNLFLNKVKDGNLSQIIYNLRRSDAGRYQCRTLRGRQFQVEATVDLAVAAVSEPKLTFASSDDEVLLQCKAECWFFEPKIVFLDDQGDEIKAQSPKKAEMPTGCLTVTRNATLQTGTKRVRCRVSYQHESKETEIYIPAGCMKSCTASIGIGVLFTLLACGLIAPCGIYFYKLYAQDQKPQPSGLLAGYNENFENLRRENAELKSMISKQTQLISHLKVELKELKSKHNPPPQCGQSTHGSRSTLNGSKQGNQLPQCNNQKPSTSSTSNHPEPKSAMKESKPAVPQQNPTPAPQKNRERAKSVSAPLTNDGTASEGTNQLRSRSVSGFDSIDRSPVKYASSNPFGVLQKLSEDESLLNEWNYEPRLNHCFY